ncbi:hypothetical protein H0H93_013887 [Arthromyces matolae]|nr:hypothetical protein H0H93_013887 [Arthromyces matolae]
MKITLAPAFIAVCILASITIDASPIPSEMANSVDPRPMTSAATAISALQADHKYHGLRKRNDEPEVDLDVDAFIKEYTEHNAERLRRLNADAKNLLKDISFENKKKRYRDKEVIGELRTQIFDLNIDKWLKDVEVEVVTVLAAHASPKNKDDFKKSLNSLVQKLQGLRMGTRKILTSAERYDECQKKLVTVNLTEDPDVAKDLKELIEIVNLNISTLKKMLELC